YERERRVLDAEPIRNYIRREFLFDPEAALDDETVIFPDIVDSLGVMEIVDFLEGSYGISIDDDELRVENFGTLRSILELIRRKAEPGTGDRRAGHQQDHHQPAHPCPPPVRTAGFRRPFQQPKLSARYGPVPAAWGRKSRLTRGRMQEMGPGRRIFSAGAECRA